MSFTRSLPVRLTAILVVASLAGMPSATAHGTHDIDDVPADDTGGVPLSPAHDETLFEEIAAPFACGTEWSGGTRPGHGQNDWNLDFNRTSLVWPDRQHDLGQPLFAQGDGVVTYIGWQINAGTYMDIDYGDYAARYIHLVDDSVVPPLGATVEQGELIALLGDTGNTPGFAHLHLEYWDSRGFESARIWELKQAGRPQTEVTFDGNVVDPREVIVSTNCVGDALAAGSIDAVPVPDDPLVAEAHALLTADDPVTHLADRLAALGAESLDGTIDAADFPRGDDVVAVVPGTTTPDDVVLLVAHHRRSSTRSWPNRPTAPSSCCSSATTTRPVPH